MTSQGIIGSIQYTVINSANGISFGANATDIIKVSGQTIEDIAYIAKLIPDDYDPYVLVDNKLNPANYSSLIERNTRLIFVRTSLGLQDSLYGPSFPSTVRREVNKSTDLFTNAFPARVLS